VECWSVGVWEHCFKSTTPSFHYSSLEQSGVAMASHSRNHAKNRHEKTRASSVWKLHKDWRAWLALFLMLAAILMYVLSLDDSIVPR
jgi:hypothetical protein